MRNRRTALGIGLLLLICGCLRFVLFPLKLPDMGTQTLSGQEAEALMESRTVTEDELLSGLLFAGEELPWDRPSGTFYLPVDMDEPSWETGTFQAADSGVKIWLLDNPAEDDKQEAVREGKSYRILAVSKNSYREYRIVFTGLPVLTLDTDSGAEIRYEEIHGSMRV